MKRKKSYFADSSFLIDLARDKEEAANIQENYNLKTSILCVYELAKLSELTVTQIISNNDVKYLDEKDIENSVKFYRSLKREGEMINQTDLLIAGQAKSEDLTLLTADDDFTKIKGLKTESYR